MSERRTLPRREILPLEQLSVGDHFNFAYRVVSTAAIEPAPGWVVTEIAEDFYKVRLTPQSAATEKNQADAIEMKVPKSTMVARSDKTSTNGEN